jgi:hypothetical protein
MSIKKEKINGRMIDLNITSSSLKSASFDCLTEKLVVNFNNGASYEYRKVPTLLFTKFRLSESQGKFFNRYIAKEFKFKKLSN